MVKIFILGYVVGVAITLFAVSIVLKRVKKQNDQNNTLGE